MCTLLIPLHTVIARAGYSKHIKKKKFVFCITIITITIEQIKKLTVLRCITNIVLLPKRFVKRLLLVDQIRSIFFKKQTKFIIA